MLNGSFLRRSCAWAAFAGYGKSFEYCPLASHRTIHSTSAKSCIIASCSILDEVSQHVSNAQYIQLEFSLFAAPVQELLDAEKENQQDIVDVIDEERSKIKATTQITEVVWSHLALLSLCYSLAP